MYFKKHTNRSIPFNIDAHIPIADTQSMERKSICFIVVRMLICIHLSATLLTISSGTQPSPFNGRAGRGSLSLLSYLYSLLSTLLSLLSYLEYTVLWQAGQTGGGRRGRSRWKIED